MNKKFIPSLILFSKGFMITCIGIAFRFMNMRNSSLPIIIGLVLIFASLVVLLVMNLVTAKKQ